MHYEHLLFLPDQHIFSFLARCIQVFLWGTFSLHNSQPMLLLWSCEHCLAPGTHTRIMKALLRTFARSTRKEALSLKDSGC